MHTQRTKHHLIQIERANHLRKVFVSSDGRLQTVVAIHVFAGRNVRRLHANKRHTTNMSANLLGPDASLYKSKEHAHLRWRDPAQSALRSIVGIRRASKTGRRSTAAPRQERQHEIPKLLYDRKQQNTRKWNAERVRHRHKWTPGRANVTIKPSQRS